MKKLTYEEFKEKYCSKKIDIEILETLRHLHNIEDPNSLLEDLNKQEYERYISGYFNEKIK